MPVTLSQEDLSTLWCALHYERQGHGIFPSGAGQWAHFRKLERRGWLEFDEYGRDINGEHEDDVALFRLTAKGRELAELLGPDGAPWP